MILIGALEFDGPEIDIDMLSDEPGLYALICEHGGEYEMLELGEAESLREFIQSHSQRVEWSENGLQLSVAVHYTNDLNAKERMEILDVLESEFDDLSVACA